MTKKRKEQSRIFGELVNKQKEDSTLAIDSWEDLADSEDEFHINRDKVLLDEEPAAKRQRKWHEEDKFLNQDSEEEILSEGFNSNDSEYDSDSTDEYKNPNGGDDAENGNIQRRDRAIDDEEEDEMEGWGASKKDYYNADAIETEQDALDEEAEALRIQKQQLQAMSEADFGFDEDEWIGQDDEENVAQGPVSTEVLPQLQITESMSEVEKMKIMHARYPEFEHISREYLRLQRIHDELAVTADVVEGYLKLPNTKFGKEDVTATTTTLAMTKYRACAAYLASMAMYFAILGSKAGDDDAQVVALSPTALREHPVMESLLKCRELWTKVETLPAEQISEPGNLDEQSFASDKEVPISDLKPTTGTATKSRAKDKKDGTQDMAKLIKSEAAAKRAKKMAEVEAELASLDVLTHSATLKKAAKNKKASNAKLDLLEADDPDFGEEASLTAYELAEKARRKKSLRFYTSQIAQKANKRGAAGKDYGGDADVPHRERLKDRQARLQAEAENRGQNDKAGPGVILLEDMNEGSADEALAPSSNSLEDDEGYYNMIAARSNAKKQAKLDRSAAYALAAQQGAEVVEEEVIGEDGRRMISYQIAKNKGLTPHRKKIVRNPRLKKKLKYQDKQKKLKSMKQVFDSKKAAQGSASYGGELTGIKKDLVRSRKL